MRAVHISKVTGIAGSEGHLLRLLPGLAARGVDCHMLILEDPAIPVPQFRDALQTEGIPAERIPIHEHLDPGLVGRLARRLRALQPDIVHTHLIHADLYGLWAAARTGVPCLISSRHNDDAFRTNPLIQIVNRWAMRRAARVITISEALGRFVREVERISPEKVITVHYGLEAPPLDPGARARAREMLGITDDGPLVGLLGRLVRQKGVDVLIGAFPGVRAEHPSARLLIMGDGPLWGDLTAQAQALDLDEAVTFTGWRDDARALMPACDVIVMPSRWEGFGLVTLEAMGCARPVIASRVSALPEIVVDGETGRLVPPDDPPELSGAIVSLLDDPVHAAALGRAGYERLINVFSVEAMVQATLDVYEAAYHVAIEMD